MLFMQMRVATFPHKKIPVMIDHIKLPQLSCSMTISSVPSRILVHEAYWKIALP